jgi:hypothetical protein
MSIGSHSEAGKARTLVVGVILALACLLTLPSLASADYEQVPELFGQSGEGHLKAPYGMAVNSSGAGGVEAGSIYVSDYSNAKVLRFSPGQEGEAPKFREAWGWGIAEGGPSAYVRCGPAWAEIPEGSRPANAFPNCKEGASGGGDPEATGNFGYLVSVAVNPANGDVYTYQGGSTSHEHHLIHAFTPTGTPIGEGFGDLGRSQPAPAESIAEGPDKLHNAGFAFEAGIAVDETGVVYVTDREFESAEGTLVSRIMSFKPQSSGDFEHYVYAGQAKDITIPRSASWFRRIALAGPNRLVGLIKNGQLKEYAPGNSTAICSRELTGGEPQALAANPVTGEIFVLVSGIHFKLLRLGACNEGTGEFPELQKALSPTPELGFEINVLAVNPSLSWGPGRPGGVVYGGAPDIGYVFAQAEEHRPPDVESETVMGTNSNSTTLRALIDPHHQTTKYTFQYVTAAQYDLGGFAGAAEVPASPATLDPSGIATAPLTGLAPDTAYRFRVVAESQCDGPEAAPCVVSGETASFSTYPVASTGLPDSRAYELVSPAKKQGGEVFPADGQIGSCLGECKPPGAVTNSVFPMQSAPDGDSVSFMGFPFSPEEGAAVFNSYISRRTGSGWQTTAMSPRRLGNQSFVAYSEGLDQGAFTQSGAPLAEGAQPGTENIYLQDGADPAALQPVITEALYEALAPSGRPYRGFVRIEYAGHSDDFAAQYFSANDSLTFATPYAPEPPEIFSFERNLYESRGGQLSLVNVLPGNTEVAKGATFVSTNPQTNGIAAGGRRVFWQAGGNLYMREDNRTTREVHHAGSFITASRDGLEVLLSDGCLYSLQTSECVADLTQGQGGFQGIAGQSNDLSRIYFVDSAALAPGTEELGTCAPASNGNCNLYLYEAGEDTRFITVLPGSDGPSNGGGENRGIWAAKPGVRTAQASPDGRYLAFESEAPLTGYDNVGLCGQDTQHVKYVSIRCSEVFLYDSVTDQLTCPSCNPSGEPPLGSSHLRLINGAGNRDWMPQPRYLTNRGRLFFDSGDRLSERDSNSRVEDVYEAEPQGVGSCARPNGCVSLISPGSGGVDSNFLAMGGEGEEEGSNVFFTTREQLVAKDTDELLDVYDARVDGGFPEETETTHTECQGESCQPTPIPPQETTPSSSAFQGAGNVVEGGKATSRCPKGKRRVKSKGKSRCVAKHKKRHPGHREQRRANTDRRAHR